MPDNKHTPGPWEYWENDRTGFGVKMPRKKKTRFGAEPYAVIGGFEQEDRAEMKANARRIVACVNACEGIPTDALERSKSLDEFMRSMKVIEQQRDSFKDAAEYNKRRAEDAEKQRDELLKALENTHNALKHFWPEGHADAIAAIARAKGEQ